MVNDSSYLTNQLNITITIFNNRGESPINHKESQMNIKKNDLVKLIGHDDKVFKVVMASDSGNLMLVKHMTNELWSAHVDDVSETNPTIN